MTIPNLLTLSRIVGIPLIIGLLYADQFLLATILFVLLSLTDYFDGMIARRLNMGSDFGKLMDPIADKMLIISILILLVEKGMVSSFPVILITAREILISGWRIFKGNNGTIIAASFLGKLKTVLQIIAVFLLLISFPFATPILWGAIIVSIYSGVEYVTRC